MRILHTADWHLGAKANRIDREEDLKSAVGAVLGYCESESVDVLLIAGDLFHKGCHAEDVCRSIQFLKEAFRPFLRGGGTILALTGNHDAEVLTRTIAHAMEWADPSTLEFGARIAPGRLYLAAAKPALFRLPDRSGREVQFVLMPFPTPRGYLDGELTPYSGGDGKHRRLLDGFRAKLEFVRRDPRFDERLHSVLAAHLFLRGAVLPGGSEVGAEHEKGHVVADVDDLARGWAYVALGHVHKEQSVGGCEHVRYSGSIERLRLDERADDKKVILVEVGPGGLAGPPVPLPLESTPYFRVEIDRFADQAEAAASARPDAHRALVRCRVTYTPGEDDPDAIHRWIEATFPRCYERDVRPVEIPRADGPSPPAWEAGRGVRETVIAYLEDRLRDDPDAATVLAAAADLIEEVRP